MAPILLPFDIAHKEAIDAPALRQVCQERWECRNSVTQAAKRVSTGARFTVILVVEWVSLSSSSGLSSCSVSVSSFACSSLGGGVVFCRFCGVSFLAVVVVPAARFLLSCLSSAPLAALSCAAVGFLLVSFNLFWGASVDLAVEVVVKSSMCDCFVVWLRVDGIVSCD